MFKVILTLLVLFVCSAYSYAAKYLLPNEERVYSFTTTNGKKLILAEDAGRTYLAYRFGTKDKVELEYYARVTDSPKKMFYYTFFRSVREDIYGVEESYIAFFVGNIKYVVYDNKYEGTGDEKEANNRSLGITVTDTLTKKKTTIKANLNTIKGSIGSFWDDPRFSYKDGLWDGDE